MKLKKFTLITVIIFAFVSFAAAMDPPDPTLKPGDVKHFIKTFPQLSKDLKKYGTVYQAKAGNFTYPDTLKANQEFLGILKKHGWDEHFFQKAYIIFLGYSTIVYKEEIKKVDPKMEKSIKEVKSNPHLSEAMKKQLIDQIKMAQGVLKSQQDAFKMRIHKKDLELIRPLVNELKKVIDDNKDK